MNKSMRKLFGKVIIEDTTGWPGLMYVYGSERDKQDKLERAMVLRGGRTFKRHSEIIWGLPAVSKASDYVVVKPTERQCRNFIINAFNAF